MTGATLTVENDTHVNRGQDPIGLNGLVVRPMVCLAVTTTGAPSHILTHKLPINTIVEVCATFIGHAESDDTAVYKRRCALKRSGSSLPTNLPRYVGSVETMGTGLLDLQSADADWGTGLGVGDPGTDLQEFLVVTARGRSFIHDQLVR